jgi:DNA-dependent RNA polymerase auxiliary subunit epsilon
MSKANEAVQDVRSEFLREHRDLLAFTKEGADGVMRRVTAALALDTQAKEDVQFYSSALDQSGYAGEVALADFKRELHRSIARAFLECQRNFVIEFVARLTDEAREQLENIEIAAGERAPRAVVPPPPPPPTAAEQLEAEVRRDWVHLRTQEVRRKLNNRAYKDVFDRLMAADQLKSQVTSYTDGGAEFRS